MILYYVEQKYYDNGKVEAVVLLESEVGGRGYYDGYFTDVFHGYDLYVDVFDSWEEADAFRKDVLRA